MDLLVEVRVLRALGEGVFFFTLLAERFLELAARFLAVVVERFLLPGDVLRARAGLDFLEVLVRLAAGRGLLDLRLLLLDLLDELLAALNCALKNLRQ